jgi:predicted acyltransferase
LPGKSDVIEVKYLSDAMKRIEPIDVLRGVAVLQMIFWQIFDFLGRVDIYGEPPYYIHAFHMPINGIGVCLFAFVSGISLYVSVSRRLRREERKTSIVVHALRRYGGYIIVSLFFTTFCFGFKTFFTWNEAIQGIGLSALVALPFILFVRSNKALILITCFLVLSQQIIRNIIDLSTVSQAFPFYPEAFGSLSVVPVSLLLNVSYRGFFSFSNLLPFALSGVILYKEVIRSSDHKVSSKLVTMGSVLIVASLAMHHLGQNIDYYGRSPSYMIFYIGISYVLFVFVKFLSERKPRNLVFRVLSVFGRGALLAYLIHFLFIFKPAQTFGFEKTFPVPIAMTATVALIGVIYYIIVKSLKFSQMRRTK